MNKVGIYYAYWTRDWDADFTEFVPKVAKLGFDVLEVNSGTVTHLGNEDRDKLKSIAADHGIELTYCIGLTKEYDIASTDKSIRENGIEFLKKQVQMIHYMGGQQLGGIIYSAWPGSLPEGIANKEHHRDLSVESMKEVTRVAQDCGVYLNVEVVNRFEQYLLNTCKEALDYVNRVESPNCRIMLDTFHMNIEEDSFREAILEAGDKLGHFHIGETNRRAPGRGRMPWKEIFDSLQEIDYSGHIVMEPFLVPGGEVGRDIKVYRDLQGELDMDLEAQRAVEFVKTFI